MYHYDAKTQRRLEELKQRITRLINVIEALPEEEELFEECAV